jgi:hypothetical protein
MMTSTTSDGAEIVTKSQQSTSESYMYADVRIADVVAREKTKSQY